MLVVRCLSGSSWIACVCQDDINRIIEGNVSELRVNDSKYDDNEDDADPEVVSGETLDGSVRVSHVLIKDWFVRRPLTFAKDPETGEFCPVGTLPASLVSQLFRLHTDPKCRRNWRSWKKLSWTIIGDADYKGEDDKGDVTVFGWPVNKRIPEKVMHTCTVQTSGEYNAEAFEISADSPVLPPPPPPRARALPHTDGQTCVQFCPPCYPLCGASGVAPDLERSCTAPPTSATVARPPHTPAPTGDARRPACEQDGADEPELRNASA